MVDSSDVTWLAVTHADCGEIALLVKAPLGDPFRPVAGRTKYPDGTPLILDQVMTCGFCDKPLRGFSANADLDPPSLLTWTDTLPLPRAEASGRAAHLENL